MTRDELLQLVTDNILTGNRRTLAAGVRKVLNALINDAIIKESTDTTDNLVEGNINLYYTDAKVQLFADTLYSKLGHTHVFDTLEDIPTTLAGYGVDLGAEINNATEITALIAADEIGVFDSLTNAFRKIKFTNFRNSLKTFFDTIYLSLSGGTMIGPLILATDPTQPLEAATKNYIDQRINGLSWKHSVRVSTTGVLPDFVVIDGGKSLLAYANGAFPVTDTISLVDDDTILVKNEIGVLRANHGSFKLIDGDVSNPWQLIRTEDADTGENLEAATWYVREGNTEKNRVYAINVAPITLGVTELTLALIAGVGTFQAGTFLTLVGNVFNLGFPEFGSFISASTSKTTPVDADQFGLRDSVGGLFKNITYANLKTALSGLFLQKANNLSDVANVDSSLNNLKGVGRQLWRLGGIFYGTGVETWARLDGNTDTTQKFLSQTGDGVNSAAPIWVDVPDPAGIIHIKNQSTGKLVFFNTPEDARDASVSGDLVVVSTGVFTITTTASNGLFKDGVNWLVMPGVIFNKATSGAMFDDAGFSIGSSVYGWGDFNCTGSAGDVYFVAADLDKTIEYKEMTNSVAGKRCIRMDISSGSPSASVRIRGMKCIASGGQAVNLGDIKHLDYQFGSLIESTSTHALVIAARNANNARFWTFTGGRINSTVGRGILLDGKGVFTFHVGSTNEFVVSASTFPENVTFNGRIDRLSAASEPEGLFKVNGQVEILENVFAGNVDIDALNAIDTVTMSGDVYIKTLNDGQLNARTGNFNHILAGTGNYIIENKIESNQYWFTKSGTGDISFVNFVKGGAHNNSSRMEISSGLVLFAAGFQYGDASNADDGAIAVIGGDLRFRNGTYETLGTSIDEPVVDFQSGNFIIDGSASLKTANVETPVIRASTGPVDLNVQGILNGKLANGGTLVAKKQRAKETVDVDATVTTIRLNDGSGGDEIITESDTATFNTKALMAQQMVVLINANVNLDLSATQDTPGTDEFFFVDGRADGNPYTRISSANLTSLEIRKNSFEITDVVGGTVVDSDNLL